jgi:UDP-2-acetamido-2,6-beta-L-arabino-hexul-4-ose reductase
MLKIGITGSNGFIGWHLSQTLSLQPNLFELVEFEREWFDNKIKLDEFVLRCDAIIHLASVNRHENSELLYETNIRIAKNLVKSLISTSYDGQLIFSSSIHEIRDDSFGKSKKYIQEIFSNWSNDNKKIYKGLIIPNVFGPFGLPNYNSVVATFCYQLTRDIIPIINNDASLGLIYIDDLIKQIIKHILSDSKGIFKIEPSDTVKISEMFSLLSLFKEKYFIDGEIPNLKSVFEHNLFNTFRSFINLETYFPVKYRNNIDERGNFVEIIRQEIGGQVSFSTAKPGITRGNHFHTRKIERFSVIKGNALIQLRKKNSSQVINYYLNGDEPSYVDIPIWYTHNIKNVGDNMLYTIFWINESYDPNNSDTYFENV